MAIALQRSDTPFAGDSEMATLMRATDWSRTPLGPVEAWPQSLKTAISIILGSRYPMFIWWGPELIYFYNDAYRPIFGTAKHPQFLGRSAREAWAEIWDSIGPLADQVFQQGQATYAENMMLVMERSLYKEEVYFTFSYSPITQEDGTVGGLFCACFETTEQVIAARRLSLLRQLTFEAGDVASALASAVEAIGALESDVPFCQLYASPDVSASCGAAGASLPDDSVLDIASGRASRVIELPVAIAGGAWPEPVRQAYVGPIPRVGETNAGVAVLGISPRRAFDDAYREFFDLVCARIGSILDTAEAYEAERKRAEVLAELDRAKTAFFSNVSHEFRTPLTLILGPLEEMLSDKSAIGTAQHANASTAYRNSLRMLRLVNTLLDFSRIESGKSSAVFEATDIATLTRELAAAFSSAMERAGLDLKVDCPPLAQPVFVDRDMWEKIVLNLISNALKFTFEGEIRVELRERPGEFELSVADTGTGIGRADLPRIFERFHRVRDARSRTHEGSGIGLAFVRELVRLHGGEVTAESEVGRGSTFRVIIPTGNAHLPAEKLGPGGAPAATSAAVTPFVEEALRWLPGEPVEEESPLTGAPIRRTRHGGAQTILLADDNADMREYVTRLLEGTWDVIAVPDGTTAYEVAMQEPIDLVLSDVMMPGMGGFELLAALRDNPKTVGLPVILLSARAGEDSLLEGLDAGADDYLVKPFSASELLARVTTHLRARAERVRSASAISTSEARYRSIFDSAGVAIWEEDFTAVKARVDELQAAGVTDFAAYLGEHPEIVEELIALVRIIDVNEEVLRKIGARDKDEALASLANVFTQETRPAFIEEIVALVNGERSMTRETVVRALSGTPIDVIFTLTFTNAPASYDHVLISWTDITARKRAEDEVRRALAAKDEFLGLVSHELRTPITTVLGNAELLARRGATLDEASRAEALADVLHEAQRLNRIITDLLTLARAEQGALETEPMVLNRVILAVVREHETESGGVVAVDEHNAEILVSGHESAVTQVIRNYLSNAAKYGGGSPVEVVIEASGDEARVRVLDRGLGVKSEELGRVFEPFYRSPEAHTKSGIGIGLSVCQRLADAIGGRVWAARRAGGGSEFGLAVPLYADEV